MFLHHQREHSNDQFLGRRRLSNVVRERVKNHLVYYQLGVDKANKLTSRWLFALSAPNGEVRRSSRN